MTKGYVVGIDLGTSNSVLAFAAIPSADGLRPEIQVLDIPQLVRADDLQSRRILPSSLYLPGDDEFGPGALQVPWPWDGPVVGEAARHFGAEVSERYVGSAKSWLCHGGVERTRAILPWEAPEDAPRISPTNALAAILRHLSAAWNEAMGAQAGPLSEQPFVVLTVPASFDETARALTLEAARAAGLPNVILLEEPLAAFYAFVDQTGGTRATTGLAPGQRILVADIGGGTSDFSVITVTADSETGLEFERTAVGEHLLLGGDNMDLALAHVVERRLGEAPHSLDARAWGRLRAECRLAKEALFADPNRESITVAVTGRGRQLVKSVRRADLTQADLKDCLVDGYFPEIPAGGEAAEALMDSSGLSEFGLPYAADPRITVHLADFLRTHGESRAHPILVDAILFNGGTLKPPALRTQLCSVLGRWQKQQREDAPTPRPLIYDEAASHLETAVARGAARYALVRAGYARRIGDGAPHSYYLGLADGPTTADDDRVSVVCVAPRGMQEGERVELAGRSFRLTTNRPVRFDWYASRRDESHAVGAVVELPASALHALPPLQTVIRFGKQPPGTEVPIRIQAERTTVGTLALSCFSPQSGSRFQLEFDLRAPSPRPDTRAIARDPAANLRERPTTEGDVDDAALRRGIERIDRAFGADATEPPAALMRALEDALDCPRDEIPLATLRALGEALLSHSDGRQADEAREARWLNATGFMLRPGFGAVGDDWRAKQVWRIFGAGPKHRGAIDVQLQWWILWRRVAGGLGRGHQEALAARLFPLIIPAQHKRAREKPPKPRSDLAREMWRTAASLEQLSAKSRRVLGQSMLERVLARKAPKDALWCLGRVGARRLLYGPRESTVAQETAAKWATALLEDAKGAAAPELVACIVSMARCTGDRHLDLDGPAREALAARLDTLTGAPEAAAPLRSVIRSDLASAAQAFGEGLPAGLRLGE